MTPGLVTPSHSRCVSLGNAAVWAGLSQTFGCCFPTEQRHLLLKVKTDQEAHAVQFFYIKVGLLKYFEAHFTSSQLPGVQTDSSQSTETEQHMNQPQLSPAEVQKQNNPRLKKNLWEQQALQRGSCSSVEKQHQTHHRIHIYLQFLGDFFFQLFRYEILKDKAPAKCFCFCFVFLFSNKLPGINTTCSG